MQLGSRLEIARAKLEILAGLKPGGLLVYNGDEPLITKTLQDPATIKPTEFNTATFGLQATNDDYPSGMMFLEGSTVFTSSKEGARHCNSHYLENIML